MIKRPNVTKEDILKKISTKLGLPKSFSEEILDNIFKIIIYGLKRDGKVKFTNFGTFKILNKSPRIGRNPTTKKEYQINSRRVISFVSAKYIKNKINN